MANKKNNRQQEKESQKKYSKPRITRHGNLKLMVLAAS